MLNDLDTKSGSNLQNRHRFENPSLKIHNTVHISGTNASLETHGTQITTSDPIVHGITTRLSTMEFSLNILLDK